MVALQITPKPSNLQLHNEKNNNHPNKCSLVVLMCNTEQS